jgi:hypothetical protein
MEVCLMILNFSSICSTFLQMFTDFVTECRAHKLNMGPGIGDRNVPPPQTTDVGLGMTAPPIAVRA